uniref:non-specific serine/threonine protein kinase n=1 Tax=Ditylenchus dipsaci TaxID=166011 RepID=A0A915D6I5_9BILA
MKIMKLIRNWDRDTTYIVKRVPPISLVTLIVMASNTDKMSSSPDTDPLTPTSIQQTLCLEATSNIDFPHSFRRSRAEVNVTKGCLKQISAIKPVLGKKASEACVCATTSRKVSVCEVKKEETVATQPVNEFPLKTTPITDEYKITHEIIGIGESGKRRPRSRREVYLHYLTNQHENIVSIMDIFENTFDSVKCLFENQGRHPYSEKCVSQVIRQLGKAVQYLHEMNIAHRDIKLENILCSTSDLNNCVYKLADFGFAKRPERNNLMESPCCTPAYVCPEILSHERYDKSCDMWAIGVVMYILLCGYPPFYSMKGLPFSPGMKDRITVGLYAFPSEDWDHIAQSTKNEIRHLLRTDPHSRTTIQQLMTGQFLSPNPLKGTLPIVYSDTSLCSMDEYTSAKGSISPHTLSPEVDTSSPDSAIEVGESSSGTECCGCSDDSEGEKKSSDTEKHWKPKFVLGTKSCRNKCEEQRNQRNQLRNQEAHAMSVRCLRPLPTGRPAGATHTTSNDGTRIADTARLFSIQEEVGRALDLMRLGGDNCFMKSLKVASGNKLLERRKTAAAAAISAIANA